MTQRRRPRASQKRAAPDGCALTVAPVAELDEHEALDRLLRYAKRVAEAQDERIAALFIEAAIATLSGHLDRRLAH